MRSVFAHDALVRMEVEGDLRAVGAAVTAVLCGHWRHDPPCPLAPHHTQAQRHGDEVTVRVLFATEPDQQTEVRRRIEAALALGRLVDDAGAVTEWLLVSSSPGKLRPSEQQHGQRLARS